MFDTTSSFSVANCGGTFVASDVLQHLVLPEFPDYPLKCIWTISASNQTKGINVTVDDYVMLGKNNGSCGHMHLAVFSGKSRHHIRCHL